MPVGSRRNHKNQEPKNQTNSKSENPNGADRFPWRIRQERRESCRSRQAVSQFGFEIWSLFGFLVLGFLELPIDASVLNRLALRLTPGHPCSFAFRSPRWS